MKRFVVRSSVVLFLLSLGAIAFAQTGVTADLAPGGKLRVASIGANPVLVQKRADGNVGGVAIEVGRFLAEKLGVVFEPVIYAEPTAYRQSFGKGEWDIAIGPRDLGGDTVDFTPDLVVVDNLYVAAPGKRFADAGDVDKPGVRIALLDGGAPAIFLRRTLKAAELVIVPSRDAGMAALRDGKADVYGSNAENVYYVADNLAGASIVPGAFISVHMAVAAPKGRSAAAQSKLADLVAEAKRAGVLTRVIEQGRLRGVRVPD